MHPTATRHSPASCRQTRSGAARTSPLLSGAPLRLTVVVAVLALALSSLSAAEPEADGASPADTGVIEAAARTRDVVPTISGELPGRVERSLHQAFEIARERVSTVPECRALFEALGDDALRRLRWSRYSAATAQMEVRVCQRNVPAFTYVGSPQTRLCRRFASMDPERAAVTLLHEALHGAGLTERPLDPTGLGPREIDRMVMEACGLER